MKKSRLKFILAISVFAGMCLGALPAQAQNFANNPKNSSTQKSDAAPGAGQKKPADTATDESAAKEPTAEEILKQAATTTVNGEIVDNSRYTLGPNDIIEITVARHPEVTGQYTINNEGKIQYDFVGDLKIAGLIKDEVRDLVVENLSKFIVSPDVTVKITGYNSKVVYVIGEVGAPGKIYMRGDTITVREALVQAGLPTLSASTKKTRLITPADNGKAKQKFVNVEALLYEGDLRENFVMKPGDTLYIPATVLAKAMRAINPVTQPIGNVSGTARTVYPAF